MRTRSVGPRPTEIALVSDYPGRDENSAGIPLIGKTGKEINRHLEGIGLDRRELFVANLIREWRPDSDYTQADVERDGPELAQELAEVKPSLIITMGRWSARYFLGDVDVDAVYAMPWIAPNDVVFTDGPPIVVPDYHVVFPQYNPAAGFKSPDIQAKVSYGFNQLGAYLEGKIEPRIFGYDAWKGQEHYVEITSPDEIVIDPSRPIYIDSEGYAHAPWSVQYSQVTGTGCLIHGTRQELLVRFGELLRAACLDGSTRIIYHNALHDLTVLRAMGIETADLPFGDTMVMAYLLQTEPRGLKSLCARHAGMVMQDYDDILGDVGDQLARDYLVSVYDIEQADHEIRQHEEQARINSTPLVNVDGTVKRFAKSGETRYRRVSKLPSLAKGILHRAVECVLRSKRPRKLWLGQNLDVQVAAYNRLGPMDESTLDHVSRDSARRYACRDADGTGRLAPELASRISVLGLDQVYALELGTYPLIDRMGSVGLKPDLAHFAALSGRLQEHITRVREELVSVTGRTDFNANSHDHVREYLFSELDLPGGKHTPGGELSTNDIILEGLEKEFGSQYPVIATIREYREFFKLKNTFVDRIPNFVCRWPYDGRVHCTFRTTRVVTGRLAASDPNFLAMPKHGKFAPDFRAGWIEDDGWVLASWDQSQIELRILAHLSQDPYMLAVFRGEKRDKNGNPIDLHAAMAERIFGVPPHLQDESKHRLPAKSVNFGLPMGMTCFGLAAQLRKDGVQIDEEDAQKWIDEADVLYAGVPAYKRRMIAEARQNGFIRCMSGRIRYIGGIRSWDEFVRAEAERFAFSTPIQEGAQKVMKEAEAAVWSKIILPMNRDKHTVDPLIQVHDDLVMRCREEMVQELHPRMVWAMTEAPEPIKVPLATDGVWGRNWAKQKFNPDGMRKF